MPSQKLLMLPMILALISSPAMAADNPGSHQHGHAELQLAFNGNQVDLLLISPAGNILGFEHRPRTEEEQQIADKAIGWLGETPLINTAELTCTVNGGTVQNEVANEHHHDHSDEAQHADIEVTQTLTCPGLDKSAALTTPLTTQFPRMEHLDVAWAGPDGQGATRLNHGEHSFRLER
ncbi:ZrgA family zinc uptake protein [Marinobacter sp.]|uniref:ZrgA family zinc uptake protein n=1 Tax=Marinobacter sp. TaxID=50741 RepID=UPI003F9968B5